MDVLAGFTTTPLRNETSEATHYVTLGADISERRERDSITSNDAWTSFD